MINKIIIKNNSYLSKICPIKKIVIYNNSEVTLLIKPKFLINILNFFKNHNQCQYKILTYITAVDTIKNKNRFKLIYDLLSIRFNNRLKIKIYINELFTVNSCVTLYSAACWFECEIWDMFGVSFKTNYHLKRILTDYGFEGFPLRKDFPLNGFVEIKFNDTEKKIMNNLIEADQEYRCFNYFSPWEHN